jgi:murein DD-endopeptidase MepM/ murein hydrolase activator NlpD
MLKLFLVSFFVLSLYAQEYPKIFSSLGTPLYSSVSQISRYETYPLLKKDILEYKKELKKLEFIGYKVDKSQDKKEIKNYLVSLRKLQKKYDFILHLLHKTLSKAIDDDDYKTFLELTNYDFDGFLQSSALRKKVFEYYEKKGAKKSSAVLEKKIQREKLEEATTQEFFNQAKEFTYNSQADNITSKRSVSILVSRKNNQVFIDFKNSNYYDVTIQVMPKYTNIYESQGTQKIIVVKAKSTKRYTTLSLGKGAISYSYRYRWIIGNKDAHHDDSYRYRLPYKKGTSHYVSQGFNGKYTHKGHSQYAVDFAMKEGTKVYAARGGIVVKTKSDSNKGGYDKKFASFGNYVTIQHNDGTLATYYHLKRHGVVVHVGDRVERGYHIGYSGNTGYTSGPHLHFAVFKATNRITTQSIPIRFLAKNRDDKEPMEGISYTAK